MGYIKEPKGVDFLIAPTTLTEDDTYAIRAAITSYKQGTVNKDGARQTAAPGHGKKAGYRHKKMA